MRRLALRRRLMELKGQVVREGDPVVWRKERYNTMIPVDTIVWIDFFYGNSGTHVKALEELIINDEEICVCGAILTEVLCIVIR